MERIGRRCPGWAVEAVDLGGVVPAVAHRRWRVLLVDVPVARQHWRAVARLVYRLAA